MAAAIEEYVSVPEMCIRDSPYSSIIDPQLTIVDINVYDTGVQAGSMMIRKLQNPELLIQRDVYKRQEISFMDISFSL